MYTVSVIPITRNLPKESLTYLSRGIVTPGSILKVPLRKKNIQALAIDCQDAKNLKLTIRKSSFRLRKIIETDDNKILRKEFIEVVAETAEEFATNTGQVLFYLTPQKILSKSFRNSNRKISREKRRWFVIQDKDRFSEYKRLTRENFNKNQSTFICVPSIQEAEKLFEFVKKGIENYTFLLHSSLADRKLRDNWQKTLDTDHPVVIIGTPMFLSIPRLDISRIVIEHESSDGYLTMGNPQIDTRIFIENFARNIDAELIFGDILLRLETLHRHQNGNLLELRPLSFRDLSSTKSSLLDMTEDNTPLIFHPKSEDLISSNQKRSENTFVFAPRKGLAPLTICRDCGHIVTTTDGFSPMTLYEHPDGNYFYSPYTKEKRPADEKCLYCQSWRLQPLGLGIDLIEKEIKKIVPQTKIFRLDKDTVSSHQKALGIIQEFYDTPGSILLGTEFASPYLEKEIDNVIITSIDSLLALPDFQVQEKTLRKLTYLKSKATKNFVLQTRNPGQQIFDQVVSANIKKILDDELQSRKENNFPPFSVLIKITLQGPERVIKSHSQEIVGYLDEDKYDIYPAHVSKIQGLHVLNILIRIPQNKWPNKSLAKKLQSLSKNYKVQVHPENIL